MFQLPEGGLENNAANLIKCTFVYITDLFFLLTYFEQLAVLNSSKEYHLANGTPLSHKTVEFLISLDK